MTGSLFIASTAAFMTAATVLSMTLDWPDILWEPADVVLPEFAAGGASLVWTWFAVAWTYAVLAVPILLLPTALARRGDAALRVATNLGAASAPNLDRMTARYFTEGKSTRSSERSYDESVAARLWEVRADRVGLTAPAATA
ncbi:hypothetical protein E0H75_41505 [Kribbella capetownensis]|uniref:Uncharacterized protein n=1 Tax=Kribbella capetownensis TaxID=1572659 RepID=A0A4R0J295_9ACTN|nr:hypothetical protein [Kribbella capetownensis]TCC35265.1 hypothetical protein E0H75_41505 [Kribbella capetownensis]